MTDRVGRVILIGAGPGDPGLITARGLRQLSTADVVVYDRGVTGLLRFARADAERIEVGAPAERPVAQDAISLLLVEKAREGHVVARLKWGDPFVFDSGGKEALFLRDQSVPFEVVPGIPAAIGATAYAGVPLTYPGSGDVVVFVRGFENETEMPLDVNWHALAALDGTIVCYANGRLASTVLQALLDHGRPPDQAAALIVAGTTARQHTITGTIATLAARTSDGRDAEPATLIVGEVASLRDHLRWFDDRPLFGRRIVITRSGEQAGDFAELLENVGAEAIEAPTFRIAPPDDPEALERAAASIDGYQWVIFEAANAVARFLSALVAGPRDLRALGGVSVCAVGPSTAELLTARGIKPDVVIPEVRGESVVDAIAAHGSLAGQRVLIIRPDHLREQLAVDLTRRGADVTDLVAYRTTAASPDSPDVQRLYGMLLDGRIDAVTFTSPASVRRFVDLIGAEQAVDLLNTTVVAAIGPVTAAAAEQLGIKTTIVPSTYTPEALVAAMAEHFAARV
jgi:uroporphyrinogen III methyltransferase/synthase